MAHSQSVGTIAAALAKAQGEMAGAAKDSKNPHFNSKYADLASIAEACRVPLAKNEIAHVQSGSADGNVVKMTTLLVHSSGEWIESDPLQVVARDGAPQAVGSCLTYLRRYQLAAMVGIAPEDDDAEAAEGRKAGSYVVEAPAAAAVPPHRAAALCPSVPNGGDSGHLPPLMPPHEDGAVTVKRVTKEATKKAGINRYTIYFSTGETATTIKEKLASLAEQLCQERASVRMETTQTKWGTDLVSLTRAGAKPASDDLPEYLDQVPF